MISFNFISLKIFSYLLSTFLNFKKFYPTLLIFHLLIILPYHIFRFFMNKLQEYFINFINFINFNFFLNLQINYNCCQNLKFIEKYYFIYFYHYYLVFISNQLFITLNHSHLQFKFTIFLFYQKYFKFLILFNLYFILYSNFVLKFIQIIFTIKLILFIIKFSIHFHS